MDGSTNPRFGAIDFAHWFFPLRGGGGAVGGMLGAFKMVRQGWVKLWSFFHSIAWPVLGRFFQLNECVFFLIFTFFVFLFDGNVLFVSFWKKNDNGLF